MTGSTWLQLIVLFGSLSLLSSRHAGKSALHHGGGRDSRRAWVEHEAEATPQALVPRKRERALSIAPPALPSATYHQVMHVAEVYPEEANVVKPRPGAGCGSPCRDVICKPLPSAFGLSLPHQCYYASRSQGLFPFPIGGRRPKWRRQRG
jgi:hypothetical protein